ncbi:ACT domain-containing protein [Yeguia hominis]|uniref:aspartate kinase n=1 Tax=Yeguia hominis TaxID=2763662 RepID=A0A926D9G6_9FIRM|nr:hypothetical protein [Yeguia hominis]MBC8533908.1 hypothetical protein [Yeguia hominis]
MDTTYTLSTVSEITLVTLQGCSSDVTYLSKILQMIAEKGVNVDMISLSPSQGTSAAISITIADADLGALLPLIPVINKQPGINTIISSGNCKISVYDPRMKDTPGVAAKIFQAAASVNTDIRIVNTSEVEVSILVTQADAIDAAQSIEAALA